MFHLVIFLAAVPFAVVGLLMLFGFMAWFAENVLPWVIGAALVALAAWAILPGLMGHPPIAIAVAIVGVVFAAVLYAQRHAEHKE